MDARSSKIATSPLYIDPDADRISEIHLNPGLACGSTLYCLFAT